MLSWVHIGDLHVTSEDGYESAEHFAHMVSVVNEKLANAVDFAYLPGDNANNGTPEQYARIRAALSGLRLPTNAIPGDHDFEPVPVDVEEYTLTVTATGGDGEAASDAIQVQTPLGASKRSLLDAPLGTDAHAIGEWREHGLLGSQLGPNKHGRAW